MIIVNLLPHALRPVERSPLPHALSIIALAAAVAAMGYLFLDQRQAIASRNDHLTGIQQELQRLEGVIADYERLKDEEQRLQAKVEVIEDILQNRIIWSEVLAHLLELTPDNFWYERIWVSLEEQTLRQVVTDEEGNTVIDERTQRPEVEIIRTKEHRLNLRGYVKETEEGRYSVSPLILQTQLDPVFADMFPYESLTMDDMEYNGYPVRQFTLQYSIRSGEDGESESGSELDTNQEEAS